MRQQAVGMSSLDMDTAKDRHRAAGLAVAGDVTGGRAGREKGTTGSGERDHAVRLRAHPSGEGIRR